MPCVLDSDCFGEEGSEHLEDCGQVQTGEGTDQHSTMCVLSISLQQTQLAKEANAQNDNNKKQACMLSPFMTVAIVVLYSYKR